MNILILIFSFLAVLALGTASFWQIGTSIRQETSAFCGLQTATRKTENAWQRKIYKNLTHPTPKAASPEKKRISHKKTTSYLSHRLDHHPHQYARLQLSALWKDDDHPFVEKILHRLFHELYAHTNWFKEAEKKGDVGILIEKIMLFGHEKKEDFAFHELLTALPPIQADLLCKMAQGTHTYSLESKKGYPPLLEFVSFSSGSIKHTCRFSFASLPLLHACFGEDITKQIMDLEKDKWEKDHKRHTCTKEELLALLQHRSTCPTQPNSLDAYFHFGKHAEAHDTTTAHDASTGIHAAKRVL